MHHKTITAFLDASRLSLSKLPAALVFAETPTDIQPTLEHLVRKGFGVIALLTDYEVALPPELASRIHVIDWNVHAPNAVPDAVNRIIRACPGVWLHYCYNGEFLFYPFCETRDIRDLTIFHTEERRSAFFTHVIDLYAPDLSSHPDGVDVAQAHLDRLGYYALNRMDPATGYVEARERQIDCYGGLRWRFEEHVPHDRRRIDRISLFRAAKGLQLRDDHTFNVEEYNTYACPWHNNITLALCSFRTARALRINPHSRKAIGTFRWSHSTRFDWHSQQLMDLGLMEPGQWF